MTKQDKSASERAVEAQANKTDICAELGLTANELKAITAYVAVCQKRLQAAPVEPLTAAAELAVAKRFPNNDQAQKEVDQNDIDDRALRFVEDSAFGYPAGNLAKPAPIEDAKNQQSRAAARVIASQGDESREVSWAKSVRWLAQMQVQQQYKDALNPIFQAVHQVHRGYKWQAPDKTQESGAVKDEALAILMS